MSLFTWLNDGQVLLDIYSQRARALDPRPALLYFRRPDMGTIIAKKTVLFLGSWSDPRIADRGDLHQLRPVTMQVTKMGQVDSTMAGSVVIGPASRANTTGMEHGKQ